MANVRVRYSKTNQNGLLQSVQKFQHPTNGQRFKVLLNTTDNQWTVIDDVTDIPVVSGHQKDLHRMKAEVKKALATLGIAFEAESRKTLKNTDTLNETLVNND